MNIVILDAHAVTGGTLSFGCFGKLGDLAVYDRTESSEIIDRSYDADILITNKTKIDRDIIEKLPNLKYIGLLSTGYDIVDIKAAAEKNIPVTNIPAYSTSSVAQLVFSYILEDSFNVRKHSDSVKNGDWAKCPDFTYSLTELKELKGMNLGILGFGSIGQKVASIANAFQMNVYVHSRTEKGGHDFIKWCDMDTMLQNSDYLTLHCPLNDSTYHIANLDFFRKMKKTAFFINTSRGNVVNENDLNYALKNNIIRAAALDVLSEEPPKNGNILIDNSKTLITPHIAWATVNSRKRLIKIAYDNVNAFINGKVCNKIN